MAWPRRGGAEIRRDPANAARQTLYGHPMKIST
jgi:hypothetical protein